jgi:D-glycero-alpha-D-manno-heptose-7-phosphate kinase
MIYRAKAPLRLGFAGGGTDVEPYSSIYGGGILNATINKYAYATIIPRNDNKIIFKLLDKNKTTVYQSDSYIKPDGKNDLLIGAYNRIVKDYSKRTLSFELITHVDAPPGSGLGSSSTLLVAIICAFSAWLKIPLGEYDLAHLSYEIERKDLDMEGGKQDQYSATFGGFNFMEFYDEDKVVVNPLRIKPETVSELEYNLLLYYTGTSRVSSNIIKSQSINIKQNKTTSVEGMNALKELAFQLKKSLLWGKINEFGPILDMGWKSKKLTACEISNPEIDDIYVNAIKAGATGGKISGAGGGGYLMFYCPGSSKFNVIKQLQKFNGRVENFQFSKSGAFSWIGSLQNGAL